MHIRSRAHAQALPRRRGRTSVFFLRQQSCPIWRVCCERCYSAGKFSACVSRTLVREHDSDDGDEPLVAAVSLAAGAGSPRRRDRRRRDIDGPPCVSVVEVFKVRAERCVSTGGWHVTTRAAAVAHRSPCARRVTAARLIERHANAGKHTRGESIAI